jgi:hypothetical protein
MLTIDPLPTSVAASNPDAYRWVGRAKVLGGWLVFFVVGSREVQPGLDEAQQPGIGVGVGVGASVTFYPIPRTRGTARAFRNRADM